MALGYAELIQDAARRSRAYRLVAEGLVARGHGSEARRAFERAMLAAKNVEERYERARALSELAPTLFESGESRLARDVAVAAEAAAREERNTHFSGMALVRCVWAHVRVGNKQLADALATETLKAVEREDDRIRKLGQLFKLQAACEQMPDPTRANEIETKIAALIKEVNAAGAETGHVYFGYARELCQALLDVGDIDTAIRLSENWLGPDWEGAGILARAATALIGAGHTERGVQIAEQSSRIARELFVGDRYDHQAHDRIETVGYVAEALARAGRYEDAMQSARSSPDAEAGPRGLGMIALVFAQRGLTAEARSAADSSLASWQKPPAHDAAQIGWLAATANAMLKAGRTAEATETASRALRVAEALEKRNWETDRAMEPLVQTLAMLGDLEKALSVAERMDSGYWRVQAFTHILRAAVGRPEDARDFVVRANIGESEVGALGRLSLALADAGLPVDSIDAARRTVAAYSQPPRDSSGDPDGGLSAAAQALARTAAFDEASSAIEQFKSGGDQVARRMSMKARALATLTAAFEAAGDHRRARAAAKVALDSARRARRDNDDQFCHTAAALNAAATALGSVGDQNKANAARREALDIALSALGAKESVQ